MTKTWISMALAMAAAGATTAACGSIEPAEDLRLDDAEQHIDPPCQYMTCANSPEVMVHGIHELNLVGLENEQHLRLRTANGRAQLYKNGAAYELLVKHSRISGLAGNGAVLEKGDLINAELHLMRDKVLAARIVITSVRSLPYAYGPPGDLEVYRMRWASGGATALASTPTGTVCNELLWIDDEKYRWGELLGMERDEVVVFEGDRINAHLKTMSQPKEFDLDWINLGCAGRATAKLHLTRNTASSLATPDTVEAWKQRQAMFKMLAADYCGTGRAFTISGTRLAWIGGGMQYAATALDVEARWNEEGATCLGRPRMLHHPDVTTLFGDLEKEIKDECPALAPCTNTNVLDRDGAEFLSANY